MCKYILVYEINDYSENGGGTYFESFEMSCNAENELHDRVNALALQHKELFTVTCAGFLQIEFGYEPVEIVKKYEPVRKN